MIDPRLTRPHPHYKMNTMTNREMVEVIQAHSAGKTIEEKYKDGSDDPWELFEIGEYGWDFQLFEYRVKSDPNGDSM